MRVTYYSLFYQLLRFAFWVRVKNTQEWTALLWMSLLMSVNMLTIYEAVLQHFSPIGHKIPIPVGLLGLGLIVVFNYNMLLRNNAYQLEATMAKQSNYRFISLLAAFHILLSSIAAAYYLKQMHDANALLRRS